MWCHFDAIAVEMVAAPKGHNNVLPFLRYGRGNGKESLAVLG